MDLCPLGSRTLVGCGCLAFLLALGCAGEDSLGSSVSAGSPGGEFNPSPGDGVSGGSSSNGTTSNGGGDGVVEPEPYVPENEEDFSFQAPRSSRNFVFVANTSLDSVAKVDAVTLEVTSIEVGDRPTVVRTYREENLAVVLSPGSDEVTVIRAGDAVDEVVNLKLPPALNSLILAPGGDYALAYYDFEQAQLDEEFEFTSAPPFQDVALVKLAPGEEQVFHLTVGFQVLDIEFDELGERAFVITRTGVSVVPMADVQGDKAFPPVSLTDVEDEDETDREVEITGDGRFAFVRTAGLEGINVVDLQTAQTTLVTMSGTPTDLDIVPGENRALAVVRQSRELVVVDLPDAIANPEAARVISLGDEPAGLAELTQDASRALVFTSAQERKAITVVDLDTEAFEVYPLRKGVKGVAIAPSGEKAVIFHTKLPGEPTPNENSESFIAKSWGYSLFDLRSGHSKLETVPAEPGEFVFSDVTDKVYVLLSDTNDDVRQIELIDLGSSRVDSLRLGSPPEHIGLIPNDGNPRVYVSQEHPVGRMTFINEQDGEVKTVTGYQLNSLIE